MHGHGKYFTMEWHEIIIVKITQDWYITTDYDPTKDIEVPSKYVPANIPKIEGQNITPINYITK